LFFFDRDLHYAIIFPITRQDFGSNDQKIIVLSIYFPYNNSWVSIKFERYIGNMIGGNMLIRKLALTALCCIQFSFALSMNLSSTAWAERPVNDDSVAVERHPALGQASTSQDGSQAYAPSKPSYAEGEVLVKWKQEPPVQQVDSSLKLLGITRSENPERSRIERLKIDKNKKVEDVIKELQANPNVLYAQPNYIYHALELPAIEDARFGEQWALNNTGQADGMPNFDVDAPEGWKLIQDKGIQMREVVVAVVDSGIDFSHPDLQGMIWTNKGEVPDNGIDDDKNGFVDDVHGWDFVNNDNDPSDELANGHGTHVSGIIGAVANQLGVRGIAPNVKIMPLKTLDAKGDGLSEYFAKAIDYAIAKGVMVSNNSYGSVGASRYDYIMRDAIEASGMLYIAAAGNAGKNNDDPLYQTMPASLPSNNILSVASTNRYGMLSQFSNYGLETVDIAAPGEEILSTNPGSRYVSESGTSMATPMVTGLAAVLMGVKNDWTVEELRAWIMTKSVGFTSLQGRIASGKMINLYHALDYLLQDSTSVAVTGLDTYTVPTLFIGKAFQINYGVYPPSATNKVVTWTSSDPQTATVDASGRVTGLKPGTATITAVTADGGFTSTEVVTILEDYSIEITDQALEMLIRENIGKLHGALLRSDVYGLRVIHGMTLPIYDLNGLEHFESLEYLDLRETNVSSLEPLRGLRNVIRLFLRDTQVQDLEPIAHLTNMKDLNISNLSMTDNWVDIVSQFTALEELYAEGVGLTDPSFVQGYTQLITLYLNDNPIRSTDFLAGKKFLTYLALKNTEITDISALQDLTLLEELDISQNHIVDISALANMTLLTNLIVNQNRIEDLRPVANLVKLEKLDASQNRIKHIQFNGQPLLRELTLNDNQITSINSIQNVVNLQILDLKNNRIEDVSPLAELPMLWELNLRNNVIQSVEPLRHAYSLYYLNLRYNLISDVSSIADLELSELNLGFNRITDIGPLAGQQYLEYLDLDSNQISDIRPIATLESIGGLNLSRNRIRDISALSQSLYLYELQLAENQLTDVSALAKLNDLEYVDIDDNQITSIEALRGKPQLRELYVQNNQITDLTPLAESTDLVELRFNKNLVRDVSALGHLTSLERLYASQNQLSDITALLSIEGLQFLEIYDNPLTSSAQQVIDVLLASGTKVEVDGKGIPQTPIGLRFAAQGDGGVQLAWDSVTEATYYQVYRTNPHMQGYYPLPTVTDSVYYLDTTVQSNQTYRYTVSAINSYGESLQSLPIAITRNGLPPERLAPTNVMAAVYGSTTTTLSLSLSAQDASGISYYEVYRDGALIKKISAGHFFDRGLTPGTTYRYQIRAIDPYGNASELSSDVTAQTSKSSHAVLSSLTLSAGTLSPSFSASTTEYSASVRYSTSAITVTAEVYGLHPTLKVNGTVVHSGEASQPIALQVGTNRIAIEAIAQDGTTIKTYHVNVVRLADTSDPGPSRTPSGGTTTPLPSTGIGSGIMLDPVKDGIVTKEKTANNQDLVRVTLDKDKLAQALQSASVNGQAGRDVTIEVNGKEAAARVELPAAAFQTAAGQNVSSASVTIKTEHAAYQLPASLLLTLSTVAKDGNISITITKMEGTQQQQVANAAGAAGVTLLLSNALDFTIQAGGQEVTDFGGVYVERKVAVPQSVDPAKATAVWVDPATGELRFVPSVMKSQSGTTEVSMKSPHNSVYTVVSSNVTFDDVKGHWAQGDIELLATKRIVAGQSAASFAPEQKVTRAQFAALLVRSLGLAEPKVGSTFTDVPAEAWYASAVAAAVQTSLLEGFEDGTFRPDALITREQMAVMVNRALKAAGKPTAANPADAAKLAKFQDSQTISSWARDAVAGSMKSGIISGVTHSAFQPADHATRAQAAVMLKRMLQFLSFIN
jgi:Leucine-rich repeat (LRR) protein/subtilisin family serine protease